MAHAQSVAGFVAHFRAKPAYGQVEVASAVGLLRLWRESLRGTRKESRKCPSCHGGRGHYIAKGSNDLGSKRSDVARQLHSDLSGGLRAEDLHAHAGAMVWWCGECGHVYQMAVRDRVRAKPGYCPYCSGRKRSERPIRLD